MSGSPAIVLVHGAWGSPAMWDYVVEALPDELEILVADLPTCSTPDASLPDDAAHVRDLAGDRPVILVGHSYGGAVITEAGAAITGARHLVYVAAAMPDVGESMFDWVTKRPTGFEMPMEFFEDGTCLVGFDENDTRYDPETLARMAKIGLRRFAIAGSVTPLTSAAWSSLPSTYVVASSDGVIHPDTQREMAARAGAVTEIDAQHQVHLSHPDAVAAVIAGLLP